MSGPEWLVRRVDRCVEIGERFFVLFYLHSIYNDVFNGKYRHSSIDDARAHTHTITRHRPLVASSPTCLSLSLCQAQPACLYL